MPDLARRDDLDDVFSIVEFVTEADMFLFFSTRKWLIWAWLGSATILSSLWVQVKIDVMINDWFGEFYDMIQKALAEPNAITIGEYWASLASFISLAAIYVAIAVIVSFFTSHFLFRWRTAMVEWYHSVYSRARKIEGAAQRVQEDTIKFSRIMESLGTSLIEIYHDSRAVHPHSVWPVDRNPNLFLW